MGLRLSVGLFNISVSGSFLVSNGFIRVRTRLCPRKCYMYCDFCSRAPQVPYVFIWLLPWTWTGCLVSATDATLDFGRDLKRCYDNDRLTSYITTHFYLLKLWSMSNVLTVANIVLKHRVPIMQTMCSTVRFVSVLGLIIFLVLVSWGLPSMDYIGICGLKG